MCVCNANLPFFLSFLLSTDYEKEEAGNTSAVATEEAVAEESAAVAE